MNKYLILARSDVTAKALRSVLRLDWRESGSATALVEKAPLVVLSRPNDPVDAQFDYLSMRIVEELAVDNSIPVGQCSIVVDRIDLSRANPMASGWDATLAMLILAFPEIRWIFGWLGKDVSDDILRWHSLSALLCRRDVDPLFDGSGLRNAIRHASTNESINEYPAASFVPIRSARAVALDDEDSYAYFNAYTAYRFGFRAFPVFRDVAAKELLNTEADRKHPYSPLLTFEDIFLSYPDKCSGEHYSDLQTRASRLGGLEYADFRVFVTTAHRHAGDVDKSNKNHDYIKSGRCVRHSENPLKHGTLVLKPYSGMFALWHRARLFLRLRYGAGVRRGFAPGFIWPAPKGDGHDGDTGHSAPGRLLQIASHMITRCENILMGGVYTVPDAVRCSVLATDALELLGDRTPTTAMDALKLKHAAEVIAECQFSGVEYQIEIKPRLDEIALEAKSLSRWFHRRRRIMATLNVEMATVIRMMRIFREYGQFDESLICQNRIRYLYNRLWMRQKPARRIFWPLLKYTEVVLESFVWFLAAIAGWMALFAGLFFLAGTARVWPCEPIGSGPLEQAFTSFTGSNGFTSCDFIWNAITVWAVIMGIAHVGIFISHMYMLVSRKD